MRISSREHGWKVGFVEGCYNDEPADNSAQSTEYQEGYDEGYKEGKAHFYARPAPEALISRPTASLDSPHRTIRS